MRARLALVPLSIIAALTLAACTGPAGSAGADGQAGVIGLAGVDGADGASFRSGVGSPSADLGSQGDWYLDTSSALLYGPKGATGWPSAATPLTGPQGATGAAGATGATGATGGAGSPGAQGGSGPTGAVGAAGPMGPQGIQGLMGGAGAVGPAGADGATGPAGADGATGPAGADGATGPAGSTGPAGPAGPAGPIGATGPAGTATGFGIGTQIASEGPNNDFCYIGELKLSAGVVAAGTMRADGRLLSIQAYNALFAVLGTMYGGDGASTFAIPNLADQAPDGTTYTICTSGVFPQRY